MLVITGGFTGSIPLRVVSDGALPSQHRWSNGHRRRDRRSAGGRGVRVEGQGEGHRAGGDQNGTGGQAELQTWKDDELLCLMDNSTNIYWYMNRRFSITFVLGKMMLYNAILV